MDDSAELVAAAKDGDKMAFGELIEMESQWAYATLRGITGSQVDAEDAFQEACLRAWRDLSKLRSAESWKAWFRRIVINSALDHGRKRRRVMETAVGAIGQEGDPAGGIADRDRVFRALQQLSPPERALVVLRFGHDLQLAEIARVMNEPLGTIKARLHRAMPKLRDLLEYER